MDSPLQHSLPICGGPIKIAVEENEEILVWVDRTMVVRSRESESSGFNWMAAVLKNIVQNDKLGSTETKYNAPFTCDRTDRSVNSLRPGTKDFVLPASDTEQSGVAKQHVNHSGASCALPISRARTSDSRDPKDGVPMLTVAKTTI